MDIALLVKIIIAVLIFLFALKVLKNIVKAIIIGIIIFAVISFVKSPAIATEFEYETKSVSIEQTDYQTWR